MNETGKRDKLGTQSAHSTAQHSTSQHRAQTRRTKRRMRLSSLQRMATGLSATAAPAQLATQSARGPSQKNNVVAAVGRGPSLATVAAKLVLLCAVGTGLVGGPLGVNGQTLITATTAASAAVASAAPLDIATPTSTTTADHHRHVSSDSAPVSVSGSNMITSVVKPAAEPTTVSVWIPDYGVLDWENRRGSIVSSVGPLPFLSQICGSRFHSYFPVALVHQALIPTTFS